MADKPKADIFAGEGSIAGKLKKRREAIEAGDPTGGRAPEMRNPEEDLPAKYRPEGSGKFTGEEMNRGYRCIKR
jgi:hypothetical protein